MPSPQIVHLLQKTRFARSHSSICLFSFFIYPLRNMTFTTPTQVRFCKCLRRSRSTNCRRGDSTDGNSAGDISESLSSVKAVRHLYDAFLASCGMVDVVDVYHQVRSLFEKDEYALKLLRENRIMVLQWPAELLEVCFLPRQNRTHSPFPRLTVQLICPEKSIRCRLSINLINYLSLFTPKIIYVPSQVFLVS